MSGGRRRFPARLYDTGTEPDPRFSMANERTFLAWVRTSLALLAAGVALELLALDLQPTLRFAASLVLIVAGIATPIQAWFGWMSSEKAMRLGEPLPSPNFALPAAVAAVLAGVLVFLAAVLR